MRRPNPDPAQGWEETAGTGRPLEVQIIKIRVHVKPNAKTQDIQTNEDGSLLIRLKSPPVEGKANAELIKLLASRYRVPQSSVRIKAGASSKEKLIEIDEAR